MRTLGRQAGRYAALLALSWTGFAGVARAERDDASLDGRAATVAAQQGGLLPYGGQASFTGYRGSVRVDGGYDGIRAGATSRVRADVVLLAADAHRVGLSLFAGGGYGAPDVLASARMSAFGGLRLAALTQARHGVDLSAAASYTSLGFSQLPALVGELVVGRSVGPLTLLLNASYGQSTREGDRYGSVGASALVRIIDTLYAGVDGKFSTDLERDQDEPEFEPHYEGLASALIGYVAPFLAVQARAGVRALRYRLESEQRVGPELGVALITAL